MKQRATLVLSGGGGKGAFQAGALEVLDEHFEWTAVTGVSVGALNGVKVACRELPDLLEIWRTVRREDVYKGGLTVFRALQLAAKSKRSIYDNGPLMKLLRERFRSQNLKIPVAVGAVDLQSGLYHRYTNEDARRDPERFLNAVFASTVMPVIWEPHPVGTQEQMVDGGVRNMTPLGDALKLTPNPGMIVVINCEPKEKPVRDEGFSRIDRVALRSLEIAFDEIFRADMDEFLRINELVRQAEAYNDRLPVGQPRITLLGDPMDPGSVLRYYRHVLIEPPRLIGDALNFDRDVLDERMELGRQAAQAVLARLRSADAPHPLPTPTPPAPPA